MAAKIGKGHYGKATRLHSQYVRARADYTCENCGRTRADAQIQCAHIIGRQYAATRTDPDNAFALCAKCHWYFGKWPLEFAKFVIQKIGSDKYEELKFEAEVGKGKKVDWELRVVELELLLEELNANRRLSGK